MKKVIQKMSLVVFLLSTTLISACTQSLGAVESTQTASIATQGPVDAKEIETFADPLFAKKMKEFNVAGSSFVVVRDGKVIVNKGYGFADKEKKTPVDKDTVFQIGSVSKTFTALAAMQQVDAGKIDLHANIEEYLGGLKIPNKTGKPVTMYDLLAYTPGFEFPDETTFTGPQYIGQDISMDEFFPKHMPVIVRPPGEVYTYDNTGFLLAGYAVEKTSGIPFYQYMDEKVFKPLGMSSTSVRLKPELMKRMATNYFNTGEQRPLEGTNPTDGPQGSIISTADDMAKYMIMHLQNGKFDGKEIVSQKSLDLMHTHQYSAGDIPITTLGFENYFPEYANGQKVVLKGGNMPGHSSLMVLIPEHKTGFFMSYNNDSMVSADIYKEFMDHYFPETEKKAEPVFMTLSEADAQKYVGLYQNTRAYWTRTSITYENGSLVLESEATGKQKLRMIKPLLFEDETGEKVAFKEDKNGNINYYYYTTAIGVNIAGESQRMEMEKTYSDVPNTSSYKTHINNLSALSIMGAKSGSKFDPTGTMTQGEFADTLIKAEGHYVMAGSEDGLRQQLAAGIPNLNPSAPITRQVAAAMIQNLKQLEPVATSKVTLQDPADAWAKDAITALVSQGIVDPDTKVNADGSFTFRAKDLLKRQEASALLDLAFGYYSLPIKR
ncbi:beta-lactamase family protein [Brevibacillus brevis]|uniref:beta-lactamase family protein n=1 Tax=Brevibacillus brevis TaxID=1393 RepID=UPI001EDC45AD|nr:beta-lactamase family protein [Brevibacillus brevis]UKK97160.1 serine hydrolase [Brevibacillus brevis]